jgi:adenine-specific DNA-methyltransferase
MTTDEKTTSNSELYKIYPEYAKERRIILHHGDSLKFLKTVPNNSINLIVTSPPYNIGKKYEEKTTLEAYLKKQENIIRILYDKLKDEGSICWEVGNYVNNSEIYPLDIYFYNIFKRMGMKLRNRIIWHFGHGLHCKNRLSGRYETILWFTKTDSYTFNLDSIRVPSKYPGKRAYKGPNKGKPSGNPLGKNPSDVWKTLENDWMTAFWEFPNVKSNHPEKTIHPCQFPIELVERCILALTNEGDIILDPFCGVGTTLIAGLKNTRNVIGVDKELEYIKIAEQRIAQFFNGDLKLRPLGKKVHQPTGREKVSKRPKEWINRATK